MKNIDIIIIGLGYGCYNQAKIKVYDECNHLVGSKTTYNGRTSFCLKKYSTYHIKVCYRGGIINRCIYVYNSNYYAIQLRSSLMGNNIIRRPITFLLTDYNYNNLKIERGDLVFNGQNNNNY